MLAPLEAIQFVSNLLFARYVTKAVVRRTMATPDPDPVPNPLALMLVPVAINLL